MIIVATVVWRCFWGRCIADCWGQFFMPVIVKSGHGHWDLSFILDHCCSEEICGHCGFKVSLVRWHSKMLKAFLILVTLRSVHGHCGLKAFCWCKCLDESCGCCLWSFYLKNLCLWCIYTKEWMTFNLKYFYFNFHGRFVVLGCLWCIDMTEWCVHSRYFYFVATVVLRCLWCIDIAGWWVHSKGTPPEKKNVFFRALPEWGGGPCPN